MTPTPRRVAGCITSIRPTYSCVRTLTYLLTYLHSWLEAYKTGNVSETFEDRAIATINGLYKVVHWLSTAANMILNDLCARFKVIAFLNAAKMAKFSRNRPTAY